MAYVDNTNLIEALLASHLEGHLTTDCYRQLEAICVQRINKLLVFNKEKHYDAMLLFCMDKINKIWQNFKFDQDNAFAYFYSVIDNACKLYFARNQMKWISIDEVNSINNEQ